MENKLINDIIKVYESRGNGKGVFRLVRELRKSYIEEDDIWYDFKCWISIFWLEKGRLYFVRK